LVTTYVISFILLILITWLVLWVTKKAYSRKWEDDE
jgi:heme/copper-type cytochrome/quinol oxidase subunit 4